MNLLAINDEGSRIAFAVNNSASEPLGLRVYDIDGLSARMLWQWRPVPETHKVQRALGAFWLTDERLGVLDEDHFEVWNPVNQSQHTIVTVAPDVVPAVSPDSGQLAFFSSGRLQLCKTLGMKVDGLSLWLPKGSTSVSFRPDGQTILISGGETASMLDTGTGKITPLEIPHFANARVEWINNQYVLINGTTVYDVSAKMPVWAIESGGNGKNGLIQMMGSKLVMEDRAHSRLLLRNIDEVIDSEKIQAAPKSAYAVYPGVKIATKLLGRPAQANRDTIEAQLQDIIRKNSWVHDPSSDLVMQATAIQRTQPMDYESYNIVLSSRVEKINVTFVAFRLAIMDKGQRVFLQGWSSLATSLGKVPRGKTLAEYVNERSKPDYESFAKIDVPKEINHQKSEPSSPPPTRQSCRERKKVGFQRPMSISPT